jgi:hypothetical protein
MNRLHSFLVTALIGAGLVGVCAWARAQSGPVRLFDGKTFRGWYTFTTENGKNKDPDGVFKIEDGCFHVSGQHFGYLSTEQEYENYRLTLEFKWGTKKWPPRADVVRDAGLLYHVSGPDLVWPTSFECQIQEHDVGDLFLITGNDNAPSVDLLGKRIGGGKAYERGVRFFENEKPVGEWNTVSVTVGKNRIEHWVNGKCNLVLTNPDRSRGRINLQSEGAEIRYRNIVLEPL